MYEHTTIEDHWLLSQINATFCSIIENVTTIHSKDRGFFYKAFIERIKKEAKTIMHLLLS